MLQRLEIAAVDAHRPASTGRLFAQADGADVRVREHRRGHHRVVDRLPHAVAEQVIDQQHRLAEGDRRQGHVADQVAQRMHRRHDGLEMRVDRHHAVRIQRDAEGFEAQAAGPWDAAGGVQHGIGFEHGTFGGLLQTQRLHVAVSLRVGDRRLQVHCDALLAHLGGDEIGDLVVEAAQQPRPTVHQRHLRAQAVEDRRELAGDVATTNHDQPTRERIEVEHVVGVERPFGARATHLLRLATGGEQDVFRGAVLHR